MVNCINENKNKNSMGSLVSCYSLLWKGKQLHFTWDGDILFSTILVTFSATFTFSNVFFVYTALIMVVCWCLTACVYPNLVAALFRSILPVWQCMSYCFAVSPLSVTNYMYGCLNVRIRRGQQTIYDALKLINFWA